MATNTEDNAKALGVDSTTAEKGLALLAIKDFLDLDDRPTFILDLEITPSAILVYHNASLTRLRNRGMDVGKGVVDHFCNNLEDTRFSSFLNWACNDSMPDAIYWDIRWSAKTWRQRWRVVTGMIQHDQRRPSISPEPSRLSRQSTGSSSSRIASRTIYPAYRPLDVQLQEFKSRHDEELPVLPLLVHDSSTQEEKHEASYSAIGPFDLTGPQTMLTLSPYVQLFLNFDWTSTALGPISSWPQTLRRMVNLMLVDPRPAAFYWGKDLITMYNEAYFIAMSQRHSQMFGKPFVEAWEDSPQVLEGFLPAFDRARQTCTAFAADDSLFYLERHGYLEETYFSISVTPLDGEDGKMGFYNTVFETTRQVIADRRMTFLLRIGQHIAASREPKEFWQQVTQAFEEPHLDVPFALLYSAGGVVNETISGSSEHCGNQQHWALEGAIRVPEFFSRSWKLLGSNDDDTSGFIPNFADIVKSNSHTLLRVDDGSLPEALAQAVPVNEGKHRCNAAVFLPIRSTAENVLGFLLIGINPHKRYDEDYTLFIELLNQQLATAMASVLFLEEEILRSKMVNEQAKKEMSSLSRKIADHSHEVIEIESRFRRMADLAPVGMFHIDTTGVLVYANNNYYTLTEHPRDLSYPMSWYGVIHEIDHPVMDVEWAKLLGGQHVSFELRLKRPFFAGEVVAGEKVEGYTWIIAAAYAEKDSEGKVVGVLGCITDISRQKWAEDFQNRRRLEAIELKRQQENFIDMTSHEMRNPLSAIIQCADLIATSTSTLAFDSLRNVSLSEEVIDSYSDAAQTIVLCAQHQTRIIDDILTLSKLDSNLLVITPVEVQLTAVVETALKMFSGELRKNDIEFEYKIEQSYLDLEVDWVKLDPSRLLQVLINLMTNAIKFTQAEPTRKISISIGASLDQPPVRDNVNYLPRGPTKRGMIDQGEDAWGTGDVVYLSIQVQDTGRGLDDLERNLLFKRFSQTTPRTHVQYGGSGLGLFISKELTEAQGGKIGVASTSGLGSTFAFYVRARRCDAPPAPLSGTQTSFKKAAEQKRILANKALSQIKDSTLPRLVAVTSASAPASSLPTLSNASFLNISKQLFLATKHVLVVEDNLVNQKVFSKQLRTAGCVVHVANHGAEALAFLETTQFWHSKIVDGTQLSVILMDLEMPIMDGLTAVKIIRSLQKEGKIVGHVPIIAVTANARSEQIQTARVAGMDSVITKPFRIGELIPEIERWC